VIRWLAGLALLIVAPIPSAPQEPASQVTGVVKFEGKHKPRLLNVQVDAMKHGVEPRGDKDVFDRNVVVQPNGELANVVVRIKGAVAGTFAPPKDAATLDVTGYFIEPRVLALQAGRPVKLKNSGLTNVNLRAHTQRNKEFNVGIGRGFSYDAEFLKPESAIQLKHDCCAWQIAWIHVIDHPFFAVTGPDGTFTIKGLPAGKYELEAWHEVFGVRTASITVDGKGAVAQDFVFKGKE
jgi:hypothetical protein